MDQSKALQRLTEAADLVGMIEELLRVSQSEKLSGSAVSGMRTTLRNARESILASHDLFAGDLVARTRGRAEATVIAAGEKSSTATGESAANGTLSDPSKLGMRRRDLRTSIEQMTE